MLDTATPPSPSRDERTIVSAFRNRGALTGLTAQPLPALGLGNSAALRRMVTDLVVRRAGPHRYYLDEGMWATRGVRWGHIGRGLVILVLALACAAVFVLAR
jgi:hypothetical protein